MTLGVGKRRLSSWIESFIADTEYLGVPVIFRRWAAIGVISAAMEQHVWIAGRKRNYPNLYIFLAGEPGTGKSLAIKEVVKYYTQIQEHIICPTSVSFAAMVDHMVRSKRSIPDYENKGMVEYNYTWIAADELGTFMSKYEKEMADGLSHFYNPAPYGHERRGGEIRHKMPRASVSMLCGSTPSNMAMTIPEQAWGQGFTSRVIFVFSAEKQIINDFADPDADEELNQDLVSDIQKIAANRGPYTVTEDFSAAIMEWRLMGELPQPTHPKLIHYAARRKENLYRLARVSALDQSDEPVISKGDFLRAKGWLEEAESRMPDIFKAAGGMHADEQASQEVLHYIIQETAAKRYASHGMCMQIAKRFLPLLSAPRCIPQLLETHQITIVGHRGSGANREAMYAATLGEPQQPQ